MFHPIEYRSAFVAFALLSACGGATAQIPEPRLNLLSAQGACSGGTVQLSLTGVDLEEAVLRFSHPGISAVGDPQKPLNFTVSVAADVPPGFYDVRAAGQHGVTNPRRFEVGAFAETEALPKNVSREASQELTIPCVVRGTAQKQTVQWFKIKAVAGHELVFDCHASQLDSRMEPFLVLYDEQGRELAGSRIRALRWTPSSGETLYLALRDFISNGGPEFFYRLTIGEAAALPREDSKPPLVIWEPPAKALAEAEPNDPGHPQKAAPPFAVRGTFSPLKDVDAYEFELKKGETWWVECLSQRQGAPTLPRVVIERVLHAADGTVSTADASEIKSAPLFPGDPDFDGYHWDPLGAYTAKADGLHRVVIRDLNNTTPSASPRSYALEVRRAAPDFALFACVLPPVPNKAYATFSGPLINVRAANIRPNQSLPLRVLVVRRDGFEGEIQLGAENLPPGVSAVSCVIGPKQNEGTLLLTASSTAAPWTGPIAIRGRAQVGESAVVRVASPTTPVWESTVGEFIAVPKSRLAAELTLAVVADAPFPSVVRAEPPVAEAPVSGKVKIPLRVERHASAGPAVALKFKVTGVPGLEKVKDIEVPAKEGVVEYELDLAPLKLAPGVHTVWFRGEEKTKRTVRGKEVEATLVLCSNPVLLTLKETPKP
jgi:hypothetical protein